MKHKKLMAIVCALGIFTLNMISLTAYATGLENSTTNDEEGRAAGLIMSYSLSITGGTKTVYLTADTAGYDTMAKIGFTNIVVQHSTNGTSGWTDEVPRDRDLATNTIYHYKTSEPISVIGGYYYRVVLDHYAKEPGWFFPSSQSITNYSNVVWIS